MFFEENLELLKECLSSITQDEISQIAGISSQTVSNAFTSNGTIAVSVATKNKIITASNELFKDKKQKFDKLMESFNRENSLSQ